MKQLLALKDPISKECGIDRERRLGFWGATVHPTIEHYPRRAVGMSVLGQRRNPPRKPQGEPGVEGAH